MRFVSVFFAFALAALSADIDGKWKADYTSPDGSARSMTFTMIADGGKLTGTAASAIGESKIENGKVEGDKVSFHLMRNINGDEMKFVYEGARSGNELKLKVTVGDGAFTMDIVAKKQ